MIFECFSCCEGLLEAINLEILQGLTHNCIILKFDLYLTP